MYNFSKKLIFLLAIFFTFHSNLNSDVPYFVDFKYILNESKAGAEAQTFLTKTANNNVKKFRETEASLKEKEKDLIAKKIF